MIAPNLNKMYVFNIPVMKKIASGKQKNYNNNFLIIK